MKPLKRTAGLVAVGVLMVLSGCAAGWSDAQRGELRDFCRDRGGTPSDCDCFIELVESMFLTAEEFRDAESPPPGFEAGMRRCNFEFR